MSKEPLLFAIFLFRLNVVTERSAQRCTIQFSYSLLCEEIWLRLDTVQANTRNNGLIDSTDVKAFFWLFLKNELQENFPALICHPSRRKCMWQRELFFSGGWARSGVS